MIAHTKEIKYSHTHIYTLWARVRRWGISCAYKYYKPLPYFPEWNFTHYHIPLKSLRYKNTISALICEPSVLEGTPDTQVSQ